MRHIITTAEYEERKLILDRDRRDILRSNDGKPSLTT